MAENDTHYNGMPGVIYNQNRMEDNENHEEPAAQGPGPVIPLPSPGEGSPALPGRGTWDDRSGTLRRRFFTISVILHSVLVINHTWHAIVVRIIFSHNQPHCFLLYLMKSRRGWFMKRRNCQERICRISMKRIKNCFGIWLQGILDNSRRLSHRIVQNKRWMDLCSHWKAWFWTILPQILKNCPEIQEFWIFFWNISKNCPKSYLKCDLWGWETGVWRRIGQFYGFWSEIVQYVRLAPGKMSQKLADATQINATQIPHRRTNKTILPLDRSAKSWYSI